MKNKKQHIRIEDWEVEKYWRKWEPVEDEDSNEIDITPDYDDKQVGLAIMRKNKVKLVKGVYHTTFEEYSHLFCRMTGNLYHYNNHESDYQVRNGEIYLVKHISKEEMLVYDGVTFITTTGDWLMNNTQPLSDKECLGVLYDKNWLRTRKLPFKNHQIVAALYFGQEAIDKAVGSNASHEINHRNLDNEDNRPENLEVITKDENKRHAKIMRQVRKDKEDGLFHE